FLDKSNPDLLHNEITTIDNALTQPWTVTRTYRRDHDAVWGEYVCSENNQQVILGEETYAVSDDGYLAPTRKDQPPPDLRSCNQQRSVVGGIGRGRESTVADTIRRPRVGYNMTGVSGGGGTCISFRSRGRIGTFSSASFPRLDLCSSSASMRRHSLPKARQ